MSIEGPARSGEGEGDDGIAFLRAQLAGAACGALLNTGVERLAFRPFRKRGDRFSPLIATVAIAFILLQVAVGWYDLYRLRGQMIHIDVYLPLLSVPDLIPAFELSAGGVSFTLKDLVVLLLAAGVSAAGAALLARSRGGKLLRAVAQDPELAMLCGADPGRAHVEPGAVVGDLEEQAALFLPDPDLRVHAFASVLADVLKRLERTEVDGGLDLL